ncbi:type VI secretion system protein VasD [Pseudoalteromonas citrea]|uniref:Type VI secretion system protein VasD n=2 Tax=Pseudoalteromonas citrea TaxID=43655 RepID=A0AAD4AHF8_9GAMM|nr:type VI secretion system lipoprotein TssJ [Pseudoalteromonas citrea]KAF7769680.1 type VI secretion system protein VasD [Pseudoalteromonas citrea]
MNKIKSKLLLVAFLFISGCMTTKVKVDVAATDNLNLNQFDEALPVVLKVYQLTDIQSFTSATFDELWKADKSTLSNSLITVEERTINPSDKVEFEFEQAENAKYVAFVALFRNREDNKWRTFHDLSTGPVKLSTSLDVLLSSSSLSLPGIDEKH